jgi:ankyrin repeat protein
MDKCIKEVLEMDIESLEKCDIKARDKYGRTLLHHAVDYGYVSIVKRLLDRGVNPNEVDDAGMTPLHMARRLDVAKLLLLHGANPNVKTKYDGRTPLHYAAAEGRLAIIALLLRHDAYIDARDNYGKTPLYLAVENVHVDVVSYLLRRGANPNVRDERGLETPLHIASYYGDITVARLLIKYGADVNARDVLRRTPLHFAKWPDVAALLIRHGADVNARDLMGRTPLHNAIEEGRVGVAEVLLRHGAVRDREGRTARDLAREFGVKMLTD